MTNFHYPKILITDLDGTALGGGHRPYAKLPPNFISFLKELKRKGCGWATCTTWEQQAQLALIHNSDHAPLPDYVIIGSGYAIAKPDPDGLQFRLVEPYSTRIQQQVVALLRQDYGFGHWMKEAVQVLDYRHMNFNGYWFSMNVWEHDVDNMVQYVNAVRKGCPSLHVELVEQEQRFYMHPKILNKGNAVRELLQVGNWEPEQVVVAGDEQMDLSMMNRALSHHLLCPSNAHPHVQECVTTLGGAIGKEAYGEGVIDAFRQLEKLRGWQVAVDD